MKQISLIFLLACLGLAGVLGCKKSASPAPALPAVYMTGQVNGKTFLDPTCLVDGGPQPGGGVYLFFTGTDTSHSALFNNSVTVVHLYLYSDSASSIGPGVYRSNSGCNIGLPGQTGLVDAAYGTINLLHVSPYSGTFSFTYVDGTVLTNGSFACP